MDYQIVNVLANGPRGGTQSVDYKLDLLGRFAAAGNIRSLLGTKLHINQQTGDFSFQESGLRTWWARTGADSLTNPVVHGFVTAVFLNARREFNFIGDERQRGDKISRILYAYKGYSTLVRQGYSGNNALKAQVIEIARICKEMFAVPYVHKFSQGDWLARGHEGACWAFVLDWFRRGFKGKKSYAGAKIPKKMDAILALQEDQLRIRNRAIVFNGLPGGGAGRTVRVVDADAPYPLQSAYQGDYVTRAGHDVQRLNERFDNIDLRVVSTHFIAPEEQRCYSVRAPGVAGSPRQVGHDVLDVLRRDRIAVVSRGDADNAYLLSLSFRDYFTDAHSGGHAIGIRSSSNWRVEFFDPNYGEGELPLGFGSLWVDSVVGEYSLTHAVECVEVTRVSVR